MEFLLPDIGEGVAEGEIVKWHVKPGDRVREEQDFVEVMTDKATVMIPCPVTGVLKSLLAEEGQVVPVHAPIASFSEVTGGRLAGAHGKGGHSAPEPAAAAAAPASAKAAAAGNGGHSGNGGGAATALLDAPAARVLATPATRRRARQLSVDIRRLRGSGPHGRVTRDDVERAASGPSAPTAPQARPGTPGAPAPVAPSAPTPQPAPARTAPLAPTPLPAGVSEQEERVPLRGVRRKIAEFLSHSKRTAAHYTYVEEVDVTKLVALRERLKPLGEARGAKVTYLSFIVKAVCLALKQHPKINAAMDDARQEIVYKRHYHVGIATDTNQGLVVPVLKHADRRSLLDVAREIQRLGEGARQGTLPLDDLQGGTFTITSAGHIGGLLATPILNYPEAAIMGVHKIKKRPIVTDDDRIVVGHVMYLSLSLDHRVIDGADAARFMNEVVKYLEEPELFILEGI